MGKTADGERNMGETTDGMRSGVHVRAYREEDVPQMVDIWNEIVATGDAFPNFEGYTIAEASEYFATKHDFCGVAEDEDGNILGFYTLHPNNIERCGHICNCGYGVKGSTRGQHIGEALVRDSFERGRSLGYRILQLNAVVESNTIANALYRKVGFTFVGTIPDGFLLPDGTYEGINIYYYKLV